MALLVLLNAMVPKPGETGHDWWTATGWEAEVGEVDFVESFFHDVPLDVRDAALAEELPQSATPFDTPWPLASWPDVPTRFVQGRDDRFFPPAFQRRVVRDRLGTSTWTRCPAGTSSRSAARGARRTSSRSWRGRSGRSRGGGDEFRGERR